MGFFDKFIPKEIKKPFKKAARVVRKVLPKELRPALPFLSAALPFMLPTSGIFASALNRGLLSSLANVGTQKVMDPEGDINLLSAALAGATGYGSTPGVGENLRSGIMKNTMTGPDAGEFLAAGQDIPGAGFLQGAENIGREGLATAADYLSGSAEGIASLANNPENLFKKEGLKAIGKAIAVPAAQGSGDLAYAVGSKAMRDFEEAAAAEEAEYGANEEARRLERYNAIRAGMEENDFTDEEIQVVFDRLGLGEYVPSESAAQGGIIGLKEGGMLNFGGREMDLRGGGFVPIGKKERADDVPARLSKNEFVMTADAVRAAGGGSVNKGAQRMYDVMNKLEARA
jgi:hypothetical protein